MAIDVYLQIDGIKGESADDKHKGWIECKSVQFGVYQPNSGERKTVERGELSDVTITKLTDLATPILLQTCLMGKTVRKAKLEFLRADGDGKPIKYFEIELENVLIGSVNSGISDGGDGVSGVAPQMIDTLALRFGRVEWKYTQQTIRGGACGNTAGTWDCVARKAASGSAS